MISLNSKITRSVLAFFLLEPESEMYINELARRLELDSGNLTRKLKELEKVGLFVSKQRGKERYYKLNKEFPLLEHYSKILRSTLGIEHTLKNALGAIEGINLAFIYGSYAENKTNATSDIDLVVVGGHNTIALQKQIAQVQKATDREINVVSISDEEFARKKRADSFMKTVMKKKRIKLI